MFIHTKNNALGRSLAGLIRRALARGAALYYPLEITDLREDLDSVVAHSKGDIAFKARTLIYTTGYELADIVPRQGSRVISTWALATAPQPDRCIRRASPL